MKIRTITEDKDTADDAVTTLERWVEKLDWGFMPDDVQKITAYLAKFDKRILGRIAQQLGSTSIDPAEIAEQIAEGLLLPRPDGEDDDYDPAQMQQLLQQWTSLGGALPPTSVPTNEPSPEELQDIEEGTFTNSPPTFANFIKDIPDGTPKIDQIPGKLASYLANLTPAALIDQSLARFTQPFIYSALTDHRLYIGGTNTGHYQLIGNTDGKTYEIIDRTYSQGYGTGGPSKYPGCVGRIGYDLTKFAKYEADPASRELLGNATIVSIYAQDTNTPEIIQDCVKRLVDGGYVHRNALFVYGNQYNNVDAIVGGGGPEADEEAKRLGQLQVAYHLKAWPDGRRLTPAELSWVKKELGITTTQKKHPMQAAQEKAGLLKPGQRWWAPTSEGCHRLKSICR